MQTDLNDISGALWLTHMLAGDFEAAWRQSDALRDRNAPDPHRFWQREPIAGKRLIVRCLHGFGDAVQMFRYAPHLNRLAAHVIFEVPPRLLPIARFFAGVENVITWGENAPATPPPWDVQLEIMELPYFFRTSLADLPIATRYLNLPTSQVSQAASLMGDRRRSRIGLVWSSGEWNPARDLPFKLLEPLLANRSIELWNLQTQPAPNLRHQLAITGDGILPLAATIANLDLVITVDTLAAHLAGALGKPAWLLLQHAADWRWLHARADSPWYPTLELFRQPTPGEWPSVITAVQHRLGTFKP